LIDTYRSKGICLTITSIVWCAVGCRGMGTVTNLSFMINQRLGALLGLIPSILNQVRVGIGCRWMVKKGYHESAGC